MWLERLSPLPVVAAMLQAACQSVGVTQAPLELSCLQTLDGRCAQDPWCVRRVDLAHFTESYCGAVRGPVTFVEHSCSLFDISTAPPDATGSSVDYLFSQQTGDLVAVVDYGGTLPVCLAGPPTLTIPGPSCLRAGASIIPSYECSAPDASTE